MSWLKQASRIWLVLAALWVALLSGYILATAEPWQGGGNWGIPFAIIVFGILPALALLPVVLIAAGVVELWRRRR
ncbi:hypothetical protein [Rhabdaerophilum sp. SD176]|uniref:hypothetical protein n=1 Tax=Rhabdaerophilum sp. SD176 TaxID=2983548 RepID=UPI0024DFC2CA|nr:hypothetical protein [Rhabdaerophilum sp. SD176]